MCFRICHIILTKAFLKRSLTYCQKTKSFVVEIKKNKQVGLAECYVTIVSIEVLRHLTAWKNTRVKAKKWQRKTSCPKCPDRVRHCISVLYEAKSESEVKEN